MFKKLFGPTITKKVYEEEDLDQNRMLLKKALKNLELRLSKHRFLCGDEMTIADLSACHELDNTRFMDLQLDEWPKTKDWLHRMIDENPVNLKCVE